MIIFGSRGRESISSTGTFDCPRCGTSKPYHHKVVKRWFTLYFIPIFPLSTEGSYVECARCGGTYGEEVFAQAPEDRMDELRTQLKGVLILVMLADGRADPDEMLALREAYHEFTDQSLGEDELNNDIQLVRHAGIELGSYASQSGASLTFDGKALYVRAAFRLLSAKGQLRADGEAIMGRLAEALELSPEQVRDIIADAA